MLDAIRWVRRLLEGAVGVPPAVGLERAQQSWGKSPAGKPKIYRNNAGTANGRQDGRQTHDDHDVAAAPEINDERVRGARGGGQEEDGLQSEPTG